MAGRNKNAAFAEESAEVEVLLASVAKTTELAKRIASSLSQLDASGKIVRDAIGPIYSNTQQLQTTSRNIDKINEAIEKLRQPLDARGQEEGIIRAGPKQAGLQTYLGALKRVDRALQDLTSSNLRSNQSVISEFQSLLTTGINQLVDLYRSTLEEESAPIEPLHFITKKVSFPTLSQDGVSSLGQVAPAIASAGATTSRLGQGDEDVAIRIYAEVRGNYIQQSLKNLATASVSTAKRQGSSSTEIYRQGSSGIGTYMAGIEAMFLAEHDNTSRIFRTESAKVLSATCAKALSTFSKTLAELNSGIKSHMLTDCFLSYEILGLGTSLAQTIDQRTGTMRSAFADALRPVRDTARVSFPDILIQTRALAENIQTLPPDGNTVPLVSQTAVRLQQMAQFDRTLLAMLTSIGEGNWRSHVATSSSSTLALDLSLSGDNPALLSQYFTDVIGALLDELQKQSAVLHRTKPLQGIFLLNSVAVLNRAINSHEDLARYLSIAPYSQKLEVYRKVGSSAYLAAWREPSAHLLDTITTKGTSSGPRPLSGQPIDSTSIIKSLSSKDKDKIKEKFKMFNASFDELVARHKSLHMEKEVKSGVSREIQGMIEPLYARFWDRYHEVDKGKGKVVKYSKTELISVLAGL